MDGVHSTQDLLLRGVSDDQIARRVHDGDLIRIRRGGYVDAAAGAGLTARHRQLIAATVPLLHPDSVISHASAAVLHGLPVPTLELERVHISRNRNSSGRRRRPIHLHPSPVSTAEVAEVDGFRVTDVGRTVVELARSQRPAWGVAAADRALALGVPPGELAGALEYADRRPGVRRARSAVAFANALAESPGESISRLRIAEHGLPTPELQFKIWAISGELMARTDFGWPEFRVVGEFDGQVKYDELLRPGETAADVLLRQEQREDRLRQLGWVVIRWRWDDLWAFDAVADRLHRALARAPDQPMRSRGSDAE